MKKTQAIIYPFDLFGHAGTGQGAQLIGDALREMIEDNASEKKVTRSRAYQNKLNLQEFTFENLDDFQNWREKAQQLVQKVFKAEEFLLWITGNHLGTLPVYDELPGDAIVVQFDAHLDIYNLSDCTPELSHGNFLMHCQGNPPTIINLGNRELILAKDHIGNYFQATYAADQLVINPEPVLDLLRKLSTGNKPIFIDLDCDVFDAAYFPGTSQPRPFGLAPTFLLRCLDSLWSDRIIGLSISEFDPARDFQDRSLETLMWLMEYILLKRYEK